MLISAPDKKATPMVLGELAFDFEKIDEELSVHSPVLKGQFAECLLLSHLQGLRDKERLHVLRCSLGTASFHFHGKIHLSSTYYKIRLPAIFFHVPLSFLSEAVFFKIKI